MSSIDVKVHGKLMLAGEYTALYGGTVLACTVTPQMRVSCTADTRQGATVQSPKWNNRLLSIDDFENTHEPLCQILSEAHAKFPQSAFNLAVRESWPESYGIGSSSALRLAGLVAVLRAFDADANNEPIATTMWDAARLGWQLQKSAQNGLASGYDLITQLMGGLNVITTNTSVDDAATEDLWPGIVTKLSNKASQLNQFTRIIVGGQGSSTAKLNKVVSEKLRSLNRIKELNDRTDDLIQSFVNLLTNEGPLSEVIEAVANHRACFAGIDEAQNSLIEHLRQQPGFDREWTAKTTGAGGEDAVLLIGSPNDLDSLCARAIPPPWQVASFEFNESGLNVEGTNL